LWLVLPLMFLIFNLVGWRACLRSFKKGLDYPVFLHIAG